MRVAGEGSDVLSRDADNLVARAFGVSATRPAAPMPAGLRVDCEVAVPLSSGLGSSASAIVSGLLGANELLGRPLVRAPSILALATEVEGHPDNVAAALDGGLVIVVNGEEGLLTERIEVRPIEVALAVSQIEYSTKAARAELPTYVALADAVYNMGRAALVVEALRRGDLELLGKAMDDRLHQAQRLEHMPGGPAAMAAARKAGAAAVAVSGSGPSLIAFPAPGRGGRRRRRRHGRGPRARGRALAAVRPGHDRPRRRGFDATAGTRWAPPRVTRSLRRPPAPARSAAGSS